MKRSSTRAARFRSIVQRAGLVILRAAEPRVRRRARMPRSRIGRRLALLAVGAATAACLPATEPGTLEPTLTIAAVRGGNVALQNGIPVPTFEQQARIRIDLGGGWRVERATFDADLSLTPRAVALDRIVVHADGRTDPDFDDTDWEPARVPGSLNLPPDRVETGGWYRNSFDVPAAWDGRAVTLKIGAANYLADVWLNGTWLGYHEGGTTPFAFDAGPAIRPGERNVLAVRVDNPVWGTRNDIVPWGLADWYNFGGLTRPVWLEAADPVHAVRADVTPHLDGADVAVVLHNRGDEAATADVRVEVLAGRADDDNLLDPDPRALLTGDPPLVTVPLEAVNLGADEVVRLDAGFLLADPALWSPASPSLYVLRVVVERDGAAVDVLHETFGLRQIGVDPDRPALRLNGRLVTLPGAALHDQRLEPDGGRFTGRIPSPEDILVQLRHAEDLGIRLIRAGHSPPNPVLLRLADRLGIAIWEEIPLYHYTPQTFQIAMRRGIAQQMLREMALRDQNRPSVLFHGLANESTGEAERIAALRELHEIDRAIDGTRLTGQAKYAFAPDDPSSEPLDVAGYTFYHGVFYRPDPPEGTVRALEIAHETYPAKPIVVLEFGRWADGPGGLEAQRRIFEVTAPAILERRATRLGGYVGALVWWTLEDYATLIPGIEVEHFGLFAYDGTARPVAEPARDTFTAVRTGLEPDPLEPPVPAGRGVPATATRPGTALLGYMLYGVVFSATLLSAILLLLIRRGGRSARRPVASVGRQGR
jgi:beta-galactosidase